ncbi:ATP11-domain-containing protein [Eremomyces bilateralis CBS 781.70]|uniref:ATP11-domain-containing protein n=1 Tax=Eremomyces bilateralis CBS 781.70 TaxID=1392243 RepID=A0A6G1GB87_9PEZI|nr:ATP11-domain-containing protein [Eremomyces bilateralis CBS 781.70]KAF1815170.1 ATP11-domain-containing protein [Eremomyces bilateralis CBS 781.70]
MATLIPSLRHFVNRPLLRLSNPQRRWARVLDVRFLATQNSQESILSRYQEKLHQKAKQEGLNDIAELKEAYREKIDDVRKRSPAGLAASTKPSTVSPDSLFSPSSIPKTSVSKGDGRAQAKLPPGVKELSSYLDVEKTRELPAEQISQIWRLRHASNERSLTAVIATDTWEQMLEKAKRHPQFILPLPRSSDSADKDAQDPSQSRTAADMHFLQWTFPHADSTNILFTHLAEYKLRGEYSQPHTTVTVHTELAESNGVVLVVGTVLDDRGVSVDEGKWLLMCMQKFYGLQGETPKRKQLLEQFTSGDVRFRVEDLMEQVDQVS